MRSFWGNRKDDSDAQVWWASQQEATKIEDDQGNNSIKWKRSQLEMVFPLVLLNRIRPVSYSICPPHDRWLIGDEGNGVGTYN
jgi:hypothetical protein